VDPGNKAIDQRPEYRCNQKHPDQANVGMKEDKADSDLLTILDNESDQPDHDDCRKSQSGPPDDCR
jgi:hypothetical protein